MWLNMKRGFLSWVSACLICGPTSKLHVLPYFPLVFHVLLVFAVVSPCRRYRWRFQFIGATGWRFDSVDRLFLPYSVSLLYFWRGDPSISNPSVGERLIRRSAAQSAGIICPVYQKFT